MDFGEILSFTFAWLRKRESLKYAAMLWVLGALFVLSTLPLLSLAEVDAEALAGADLTNTVLQLLAYSGVAFVAYLVYIVLMTGVGALIMLFALRSKNYSPAPFNFNKFLRYVVMIVWVAVASLISWYNRKYIVLLAGVVVLGVVAGLLLIVSLLVGFLFLVLFAIALLAYFVVVMYNSLRLVFAEVVFLLKEQSISASAGESLRITRKKLLGIIVALVIVGIVLLIVYLIAYFVVLAIISLLAFDPEAGLGGVFLALEFNSAIAEQVVLPISMLCGGFMTVAIYSQISKKTRQVRPYGLVPDKAPAKKTSAKKTPKAGAKRKH